MPEDDENVSRAQCEEMLLRYLDGDLADEQLEVLLSQLRDPECQDLYVGYALDAAILHETLLCDAHASSCASYMADEEGQPSSAPRHARWRRSARRLRPAVLAAALAAVAAGLIALRRADHPQQSLTGPAMERVAGDVTVDGRPAQVGTRVYAAKQVCTVGDASYAWLAFADGTRLRLVGACAITCRDNNGQKVVRILRGRISASVAPQPLDRPLLIETESAVMEVVGTDLAVTAEHDITQLNVVSGAVKFRREADGREVMVTRGQYAIASRKAIVKVRDAAPPPDLWSIDFSRGLGADWGRGVLVEEPQSPGSKAVAAELSPHDGFHLIQAPNAWSDGLFCVHGDSYLNFRIKMDRPEWYQVFICLRDDHYRSPGDFPNREYQELIDFRTVQPGAWRTVSIPFSEFRRPVAEFTPTGQMPPYRSLPVDPPPPGTTVFGLLFSTQSENRGMVIDRIWVTRGKPATETQPSGSLNASREPK